MTTVTTEARIPDRLDAQEKLELHILRGLIIDNEYVKRIRPWWNNDFLESPEIHKMAQLCWAYFDKYDRVPDGDIWQLYFEELRTDRLNRAQAEAIEIVLEQVERGRISNTDYLYDRTASFAQQRAMSLHVAELSDKVESGELDKARSLHADFKSLPIGGGHARRADEIKPLPVLWLWSGVVARSELNLLVGAPFVGKSQIALSIAAITSSGGCWPTTDKWTRPRDVLIMSAEDADDKVIVPRLMAAGADRARCHILDRADDMMQAVEWFEQHLDKLPRQGQQSLVILDPATTFFKQGQDPNNMVVVRAVLRPLAEMGWRRHVTVLVVHHSNKGMEGSALDKVSGSVGWSAAARVVHLVLQDPERDGRSLLTSVGSNLGAKHPGYAYQIIPETICNGTITAARVVWENEPINMTADQAMAAWRAAKSQHKVSEATDWLRDLLSNGPMIVNEIEQVARRAGLAWGTVRRASDKLEIEKSRQGGRHGHWHWNLPSSN
jgi:hypothetical protein